MLYEMGRFSLVKKELPKVYIGKRLYRKEITNYLDYLSSKEIDKISNSKVLHKPIYAGILRNKLFFAYHLEYNKLPTPKLHGYNFGNNFVFNSNKVEIQSNIELEAFLSDYLKNSNSKGLFVKPLDEKGGKDCYLLNLENLKAMISSHGLQLMAGNAIFQEVISQHTEVNKIYSKSINSIRFTTFRDSENKNHILSAMMRFGNNGSVVDNSSSGGFYVNIDLDSGRLKGVGNQAMKFGGLVFEKHPETDFMLDGFKIPYFKQACTLIDQVNDSIPERIVGWDIAIAEDGPTLIEGNDNNSWFGVDIAHGGLLQNPLMKKVFEDA